MRSILFHIGPIPIRAYGLMLWVGMMLALLRTLKAAKRTDIKSEYVVDLALYTVLAGIVGAHVGSILLDLPFYIKNPSEITALWTGIFSQTGGIRGLSFHAGLVSALLTALVYTRRKQLNFFEVIDLLSPGLVIGYAVTRVGCFLNGCCYGIPTTLPWGVRFHADGVSGALTPPSHPTQLYAVGASALIYIALVAVEGRRRFAGQVFLSYVCLYSVYRFLVEILRKGVTADVAFLGLTQAQIVSILMLAIALPILVAGLRNPKSKIRNRKGR
jgi:phosphatidylglycerol:prolipoprotein diacylglycerol transferase